VDVRAGQHAVVGPGRDGDAGRDRDVRDACFEIEFEDVWRGIEIFGLPQGQLLIPAVGLRDILSAQRRRRRRQCGRPCIRRDAIEIRGAGNDAQDEQEKERLQGVRCLEAMTNIL
jgi:hypothetical protein